MIARLLDNFEQLTAKVNRIAEERMPASPATSAAAPAENKAPPGSLTVTASSSEAKMSRFDYVSLEKFFEENIMNSVMVPDERKQVVALSAAGELLVDPNAKKPRMRLSSFADWAVAALTFFPTFTEQHPERAADVATYLKWMVRCHMMHSRDAALITYDRVLRTERVGSAARWAPVDNNMWAMCGNAELPEADSGSVSVTPMRTQRAAAPPAGTLPRFCADFHTSESGCHRGASCQFEHRCPWCSARHPARTCSWQTRASGRDSTEGVNRSSKRQRKTTSRHSSTSHNGAGQGAAVTKN